MKNSTIWESASKPLFVKSVWLEAGLRHFILDYEPKQRLNSSLKLRDKREIIQTSVYCDLSELDDELLMVGSSKIQYQQCYRQPKTEKALKGTYRTLSSRNLFIDNFKKRYELLREEVSSRRSSLHDISSVLTNKSNSDEKLAERVLNWLDLAGKTPLLRPIVESRAETVRKKVNKDQSTQKLTFESDCSKRTDSIKHITIIFNKDGVPVTLNRAARTIDLCAISKSVGAARGLAGNMASARLYAENIKREGRSCATAGEIRRQRPNTTSQMRNFRYNGIAKKKGTLEREGSIMGDAKRELHIFMPSLPKKTVINEDVICSELNKTCKINST